MTSVFALVIGACSAPSAPTPVPPAPPPAPVAEPPPAPPPPPTPAVGATPWNKTLFKDNMHERFAYATDAVYGVVLGDLALVHTKSQALAAVPAPAGLPAGWDTYLDALRTAADRGGETPTIEDAAADVLTIGRTCANCHVTHGGPRPSTEEVLGEGWAGEAAMHRHSYGTYLMWLGLLLPSPAVFDAGVEQLVHEGGMPAVPPALAPLEDRVHRLAASARAANDEQERVGLFADLLRTCAACHSEAGAQIPR